MAINQFDNLIQDSGMVKMMKDLIHTLKSPNSIVSNLSVGNPASLADVDNLWLRSLQKLMDGNEIISLLTKYGSSRGYLPLLESIIKLFNDEYGTKLTIDNIAVGAGSQSIYFFLLNRFSGHSVDGYKKKILLPMLPEYIGYQSLLLDKNSIIGIQPIIVLNNSSNCFEYFLNKEQLNINKEIGCIVISRPANPTGKIISDEDLNYILDEAEKLEIPVIIDSAYSEPFPSINIVPTKPIIRKNVINTYSASKAGMPGERVGIIVGDPDIINQFINFQTNTMMHSSVLGQAILAKGLESNEIFDVSKETIGPYYFSVANKVIDLLNKSKELHDIPWRYHKYEGGIFLWLWFEHLPINDFQLYQELKEEGLLVVPGNSFFYSSSNWNHAQQCIRISLSVPEKEIFTGINILSKSIKKIYENK